MTRLEVLQKVLKDPDRASDMTIRCAVAVEQASLGRRVWLPGPEVVRQSARFVAAVAGARELIPRIIKAPPRARLPWPKGTVFVHPDASVTTPDGKRLRRTKKCRT